ncbi:MAG: hypothetical protein LBK71_06545 [Verrucomicrobiales bacterium]|jgi:hypothetical protein|nr:hypothetical protein [Verrucomicrobiales bacterium]
MRWCEMIIYVGALWVAPLTVADPHVSLYNSNSITCKLTDADMPCAISTLRNHTTTPICFESEELDPSTQGIFAEEVIQQLESRRDSLTEEERARLEQLKQLVENPAFAKSLVDWKTEKHSFDFKGATFATVVGALSAKFQNYTLRMEKNYLVILPKNSLLNFPVPRASIRNQSMRDALNPVKSKLDELKTTMSTMYVITMPPPTDGKPLPDPYTFVISHLETEPMPCWLFLTKIAQASSPPTCWSLNGMKDARILSFFPVRESP